ncbi:hypothetical protein HME9304_01545 [Flagellimonas maritima]|uniref:Glycosyltransferase RgtA/B/C/D-like domain-containing protein n=1 Tax=Flagellimonas maritima TaxID=1383885 RepID=A0A2Z4LRZ0_9FLAO|nr:hypothetical protein [Allomuricauda aurantiaca]AWX44542.1 hypothetical protein HME9304_01545 [Allomuricauda aurantiaca]
MRLFTRKEHYFELIIAVIFCYVLAMGQQIRCPGPDAKLYRGLSVNIFAGEGYIDNIRNDFILPSIGHPLLLGIFQQVEFDDDIEVMMYLCFLSLVICYLLCIVLHIKSYLSFFAVFFLNDFLPALTEWGIEASLLFSILLLWFSVCLFFRFKSYRTAIFFGIALFINLLIRPMLAPLFYLVLISVFIAFVLNRVQFKQEAIALAVSGILFFGVKGYSMFAYDDSRMVSGTYSEIPLYCAFNEFIPLDKEYRSTHWRALSDSVYKNAVNSFEMKTTWQDRALLLRKKTVRFIKQNPDLAWNGYLWRLKRYTTNQESKYGTELFYIWLFLAPFFIGNAKRTLTYKLTVVGLPLYVVAVMSVFPYIDIRYALTPNLYFLCSILFMLSYLDKKSYITNQLVIRSKIESKMT